MVAFIVNARKVLKEKGLVVTSARSQVINLLLEPGRALTSNEIEQYLKGSGTRVHRATLYRALRLLTKHQVIHQVMVEPRVVKYKMAGDKTMNNHPHFHCEGCDSYTCLPEQVIRHSLLPGGYRVKASKVMFEGVCAACNIDGLSK